MKLGLIFGLVALFFQGSALADLNSGSCTDAQKAQISSMHQATLRGQSVSYKVTTGFMEVTAADNSSKACVFYTGYEVQGQNVATRPITFAFNGGPGSASLWLHMGLLGPKRVDMGPDGLTPPTGLALVNNDDSPLAFTDVVMIDPVATGFSHTENQTPNDPFFGVKNDYTSIEAFIQAYLDQFSRWDSPKYLLGESYGGIRGSLLAHHLQADLGIQLTGVVLISPALSDTAWFGLSDNNVPYWTFFPTYASTAWFHNKIAARFRSMSVTDVWAYAQKFALTTYRDALDMGNSMDDASRQAVAQEVADLTGFSKDQVIEKGMKLQDQDIFTGLLADQETAVGRYDSRYTTQQLSGAAYTDPSDTAVSYPFTIAINEYLRDELGFNLQSPYNDFGDLTSWAPLNDSPGTNVMDDLSQAMVDNPKLQVLIASGYYDLACPMGTVAYEISQMVGGPDVAARVHQKQFVGGHMMYINPSALQSLTGQMQTFYGGNN